MNFNYRHIETVDSTNAYLQRLQGTSDINGLVVSADEQTAGKGMGSNSWESAKGLNLTFSVAFNMNWLPAAEQFMLSQLVPMAMLEVLDNYLPTDKLKIKWPNDIFYDAHKLGGILINSTIRENYLSDSIIGIGLNVNQIQFKDWPTHPISMKMITREDFNLIFLLKEIVTHIGKIIEETQEQVQNGIKVRQDINNKYYSRLFRYNEWAEYKVENQNIRLLMTGVSDFGRLQLVDELRQPHNYDIKEIQFII